jgi:hypothetical protein
MQGLGEDGHERCNQKTILSSLPCKNEDYEESLVEEFNNVVMDFKYLRCASTSSDLNAKECEVCESLEMLLQMSISSF